MSSPIRSELSREMSLFQVTMMGVGMMIGAGVFVATGIGIGIAGPGGMLLAFTLNGLLAFLAVMTYAELGSALPKAGGGYSYVQESSGGFTGFITGWISWFGHAVAGSLYAITFAKNSLHFLSNFDFIKSTGLHLPAIFEHISKKTRIPDIALLFSGAITIIITTFFDVETVMAGASIFFIFLFNIVTFSGMKIRIERGHELQYGYLIPFFPLIPIISIIGRTMIGIFLLDMAVWAYIITGIWLLIGFIYYFIKPKRKSSSLVYPVETNGGNNNDNNGIGKKILVALANSATSPVLIKYAQTFAESRKEKLSLTTVVKVPYQTPIDVASRFADEAQELLENAEKHVTSPIPVNKYLRYAHNTAEGIIQAVRSRNANLLILGWRGFTHQKYIKMGSTLDPVIEKASCDLIVIKPGIKEPDIKIKKILCPTKGKGPHGKLAWNLVRQLAVSFGAEVTFMHVTPMDKKGTIPDQLKEPVAIEYNQISYQIKIIQSNNPVARITDESEGYDLVVIGASETSVFQRLLFGSKPTQIAEKCSCTIIMVRKNTGIRSWFKRWFV